MASILHTESSMGWGGQEVRILTESQGMLRRGHDVMIAAQAGSGILQRAQEYGVPTVAVPLRGAGDIGGINAIRRLCQTRRFQIVNTHSSADSWCAGIGARLAGRKVIRTRHLSIAVKRNLGSRVVYGLIPHLVVTTGQALADRLVEDGLVRPDRAVSVPTGVDCQRFSVDACDRSAARAEFGLGEDDLVVGTVAMFRRMKGYEVLAAAAPAIVSAAANVKFLLTGDTPGESPVRAEVEQAVREKGLQQHFIFAGYRQDVPRMLSAMDIFVLASTRDEGVPQSISQAMAMRLPVVATRVGGIPEQVADGETGLLVEPGDASALSEAVGRLAASAGERRRMGTAGEARARHCFSLDVMLNRMEELCNALLQRA